jgi:hypothetical protein
MNCSLFYKLAFSRYKYELLLNDLLSLEERPGSARRRGVL